MRASIRIDGFWCFFLCLYGEIWRKTENIREKWRMLEMVFRKAIPPQRRVPNFVIEFKNKPSARR